MSRTRLFGIVGWHSWELASFRTWLRACRRAEMLHDISFESQSRFQDAEKVGGSAVSSRRSDQMSWLDEYKKKEDDNKREHE